MVPYPPRFVVTLFYPPSEISDEIMHPPTFVIYIVQATLSVPRKLGVARASGWVRAWGSGGFGALVSAGGLFHGVCMCYAAWGLLCPPDGVFVSRS